MAGVSSAAPAGPNWDETQAIPAAPARAGGFDEAGAPPAPGFEFQFEPSEPAEAAPTRRSRTGLWVAGSLALTLVAALGVVAFFALRGPSAEETAVAAAEAATLDLLDELSAAQSTADLRAVAAASEKHAESLAEAAGVAPAESEKLPAMDAYGDMFAALGSLAEIDGDTLYVWDEAASGIMDAADAIQAAEPDGEDPSAGDEPTVAALAEQSVNAAGGMVAEAQAVMEQWRVAEAEALERNLARQETRAELDSYAPQVQSILSRYAAERTSTGRFMDRVRSEGATVSEAYDEFFEGELARLDLAQELRSLSYPDGMASEHDRLVAMIEAGADGMAAGYRGVEEYMDYYGFVPYDETPSHIRFQEESDRISAEFGSVEASWQAALDKAYLDAQDEPLPVQPVV